MKLRTVGLVCAKELRETLRDRRTLMVMILFPLVVYPLVSLIMAQVIARKEARGEATPSRVAVVGSAAEVATLRALLDGDRKTFTATAGGSRADVEAGKLDALLILEPSPADGQPAPLRLIYDETRDESNKARDRLDHALGAAMPKGCTATFAVRQQSVAAQDKVGGYVLSKILPLVVVVMVMLGAFYPAIDITAGERERGTLETILSAPVNRFDLMTGKVLAVAALATITGALNMASMSVTMLEGARLAGARQALSIPWSRAVATLLMVLPASFLFASVMVAIGAMARSFKEAQNLLTPVYFLCFMPALIAGLGDYHLRGLVAVVPAVNVTLLARDLMLGHATLLTSMLVVLSTLIYGALALTLAARLYDSERLLYSEDGPIPLRLWLRRLLTGHGAAPAVSAPAPPAGPGHAIALFGVAYVLLFFAFIPLQAHDLEWGLLLSQWVGMLGLVLLYARATSQPIRQVLGLRRPRAGALLGAVLIGLSAWVVLGALVAWIAPAPDELVEKLRKIVAPTDGRRGFPVTLFLMAITPAICEEALFRGPILRGFATRFSALASAVLTGVLFGLYHVDVGRLLPTGVLGIILSLVALRSGSIIPAMVVHFLNNACLIAITYLGWEKTLSSLRRPVELALFVAALAVMLAGVALVRRAGGSPPQKVPL